MLLKSSLGEPDWLSEAHPHEEVYPLSENKILENIEPESSALNALSTRPTRTLSFLTLNASKLA
ncbi:hypothetical protein JHK82_032475 [Glycine max]|nr:hypothetical protein JHK87_032412 [Glycine soja]KAG4979226.1 hypothetical protein JHK85_033184 [Glycine max]KAG4984879.1 hypothetical protein JHK86_032570 [Glycine max]KAG5118055.1 hypothetical protein JHK82_032475 [Glycine max]KAG5139040.1 hypothetical protein JHK84_032808 [Glycine max]